MLFKKMFRFYIVFTFSLLLAGSATSTRSLDTDEVVRIIQSFAACILDAVSPSQVSKCLLVRGCLETVLSESQPHFSARQKILVKADIDRDLMKIDNNCELLINQNESKSLIDCQMRNVNQCLNIARLSLCTDLYLITSCLGPYTMNCSERTFASVLRRISLGFSESRKCPVLRKMDEESSYQETSASQNSYNTKDKKDESYKNKDPVYRMIDSNSSTDLSELGWPREFSTNVTEMPVERDFDDDEAHKESFNSTILQLPKFPEYIEETDPKGPNESISARSGQNESSDLSDMTRTSRLFFHLLSSDSRNQSGRNFNEQSKLGSAISNSSSSSNASEVSSRTFLSLNSSIARGYTVSPPKENPPQYPSGDKRGFEFLAHNFSGITFSNANKSAFIDGQMPLNVTNSSPRGRQLESSTLEAENATLAPTTAASSATSTQVSIVLLFSALVYCSY